MCITAAEFSLKNKKISSALLAHIPGFSGKKIKSIPFGLLAVAALLRKSDIQASVVDLCLLDADSLTQEIERRRPDIIGFGGIATSFGNAKEVSRILRRECPDSVYIAGGPLASTYEFLLQDRVVDYVFHGEVEYSLPKFIDFLKTGEGLEKIGGLSFLKEKRDDFNFTQNSGARLSKDGLTIRTREEERPSNLDEFGYPDHSIIDLHKYTLDLNDWYREYKPAISRMKSLDAKISRLIREGKSRYIETFTSRGCTHSCRFCYRHVKGVRNFNVKYVIEHIKSLKENFSVDGVAFVDELFNASPDWIHELCDNIESSGVGLSFYMAGGMRADRFDEAMAKRLSNVGFINAIFGQESGSDEVLSYYGKGVSRKQNIDSVLLTKKNNMHTCVQLVIGSPIESTRTIRETNEFLKIIDAAMASINYIIPLPETALWEEAIKRRVIKDARRYLDRVKIHGSSYWLWLNMSRANRLLWLFWYVFLERTVFINRYRGNLFKQLYYRSYLFKFSSLFKKMLNTAASRMI